MDSSRARITLCLFLVFAAPLANPQGTAADGPPNVLLLIADDLGVDLVGAYGEHPDPATTPVIDALAGQGLLFRNAYADPLCSPTRAALHHRPRLPAATASAGARNCSTTAPSCRSSEVCIPRRCRPRYRTASRSASGTCGSLKLSGPLHPQPAGLRALPRLRPASSRAPSATASSTGRRSPTASRRSARPTRRPETVDDALELIQSARSDPWFAYVAFNAPHAPFHKPPANLHTYDLPSSIQSNIAGRTSRP